MSFRQSMDLTRAIQLNDAVAVRGILEKNPNLLTNLDKIGANLLEDAVKTGQVEIFKLLVEFNADHSRNPLEVAMKLGDISFLESLLQDVGLQGSEGTSPLEFAFSRNTRGSRSKKLALLIDHGLEVVGRNLLSTFFRFYVARDDPDAVVVAEVLLNAGASLHEVDSYGYSPLSRAVLTDNLELVSYLIARGSDPSEQCLLHQAVQFDNEAMVDLLVSKGAEVDARDDHGWTALHLACYCSHERTIALLIRGGADVNARTSNGVTPLSLLENTWRYHGGFCSVLVKEFSRLSFEGLPVSERDMEVVMTNSVTREHFQECTDELRKMDEFVFYGKWSYFGVLKVSRNLRNLARLTRNGEFVRKFQAGLSFNHYQDYLARIFHEALKLRDEALVIETKLKCVFGRFLPDVVIRKLTDHLRIDDLPL